MRAEGDVVAARADYAARLSANLELLLRSRFEWMNAYVASDAIVVDIGCGAGFSVNYLRPRRLLLTDYACQPFLSVAGVDALSLPFVDQAFDFIVASNVLHHLPSPGRFLDEGAASPAGRPPVDA